MKEIEIPEGYGARIEGNKIILESKESEDERIRKFIVETVFREYGDSQEYLDVIDYLEKQKEQKPTSFNEPYNSDEYEAVTEGNATSLKRKEQKPADYCSVRDEFDLDGNLKQKPAWSEEDEKKLELVTDCIYEFYPNPVMKYELKDWLKSLRPQSKTTEWSEEDKLTMDAAIYWLERRLREEKAIDISTENIPLSMRKTVERLKLLCPSWKPSENEESRTGNRYEKY